MHICFLDIDGTLLLTGGAGQRAFAETLDDDFGIAAIDANVGFAGRSDKAIAMDLFSSHSIEPSEENWQRFTAGYLSRLDRALVNSKGLVLPGVIALLETLLARGDVALGLLTGNMREGARRKLSHYGLWHWFAFGGFGDEHMDRCDIAAAALAAADQHLNGTTAPALANGKPFDRQVVVIGDTHHDIRCGRAINARCVAVPTGMTSAKHLHEAKPDLFVETLEDLNPILELFSSPGSSQAD